MKKLYSHAIKPICILVFLLPFVLNNAIAQTAFSLDNNITTTFNVTNQGTVTASFVVNAEKQCLVANNFVFTNGSTTSSGTTYNWDFGDGSSTTDGNPTKFFTKAGNYKVHLEVRNGSDFAFVEKFVTVMPTPQVSFNTITGTLNGNSFTFISSSTIESGSMNYFWDLGDATYSSLINPTKTYTAPGNYNVKLLVISDFGCKDSIVKIISYGTIPTPPVTPPIPPVTPPIPPLVVCVLPTTTFSINNDNQCKKNNSFEFTNGTTVTAGTLSYAWDFGDGTVSNLTSTSKIYAASGSYQVKLVATNSLAGGCSSFITKTIMVISPDAGFTINPTTLQCFKNNYFTFDNTSHSSFNGLQYQWDLAEGTTSTSVNPTKSYATAGTYAIRLIATAAGTVCKDTIYKSLIVFPSPTAAFTVSNSCNNNTPTRFTNTTAISGDAVNYEWFFGNGNSSVSVNPTEMYTTNGSYTVKLIASSAHGCIDSVKQIINLEKATAAFTINSTSLQCLKDNNFTFTNQSHATASDLNYQWNLAEGNNSTTTSPVKSYTNAGIYNVRLIAKIGNIGCADTLVKSLTVYPMPVANFATALITATGFSSNIQFNNISTVSSGNNNYAWFFTDGTSSIATSLSHQFASIPTTQIVKLIATTNNGCVDSISKNVSLLNGVSSVIINGAINNLSAAPTDNVTVYPNPVISVAQVNVATLGNQLIIVTVSDYNGRVVFQTRQTTNNTNTMVSINLQRFVPGTYLIDARSISGVRLGSQIITKVN